MFHNNRKNVLLVISNSRWHGKRPWLTSPYSALILTTLLKKYFNFSIIDANGLNLSAEECQLRIQKHDPDVILVSALSVEYHKQAHMTLALAKKASPNAITVIGGVYPTVLGEEVLKDTNVDYIFIGHAEERIVNFIQQIDDKGSMCDLPGIGFRTSEGAIRINPVRSYIGDVKKLVKPDYSLLDLEPYWNWKQHDHQMNSSVRSAQIITTFGCPYNCVFCATRTISGKGVAIRPVEDVLEEIEFLIAKYRIKSLSFQDDLFLAKRSRVEKILNAFIDRNYGLSWNSSASSWHLDEELLILMKESGCRLLTMSVESGCQRVLKEIIHKPLKLETIPPIVKKCREVGIDIVANFVIGFPGETWDEIRETFRFAEECNFDLVHFHVATPLPNTDLYSIAKEQNLLPSDFSFLGDKYFGFGGAFITTEEFTPEQLMILRSYEWDRINFSTHEKIEKAAKLYHLTLNELRDHRRQTIRKIGLHLASHKE